MPLTKHNQSGWIYDPKGIDDICASLAIPMFGDAAPNLKGYGVGKTVLLYKSYDKAKVKMEDINQGNIGSCTAAASAGIIDLTKVVEIANGERSEFKATTSIEHIYRIARLGTRMSGDGASVGRAVDQMSKMGTLARLKYDSVDLTKYSVELCRKWGDNKNYPKELDEIAKNYTIGTFSRVASYEQVRDSIAAGYAVIVGSQYGYSNVCDSKGFAKNTTSWSHAMYWSAIRSDVEGVLTQNSWSAWNTMKNREFDEPIGSFWIRPEDCDKMARNGDCWVIGNHNGYPIKINSEVEW
jgi:hypothetical protein